MKDIFKRNRYLRGLPGLLLVKMNKNSQIKLAKFKPISEKHFSKQIMGKEKLQ